MCIPSLQPVERRKQVPVWKYSRTRLKMDETEWNSSTFLLPSHPSKSFKSCRLFPLSASPLWAVDPFKAALKWRSCRKCLHYELKACGWCGQQLRLLIQTKHKGQRALFTDGNLCVPCFFCCFFNATFTWKGLCPGLLSALAPTVTHSCSRGPLVNKVLFELVPDGQSIIQFVL